VAKATLQTGLRERWEALGLGDEQSLIAAISKQIQELMVGKHYLTGVDIHTSQELKSSYHQALR